jgi:hypothetical protein
MLRMHCNTESALLRSAAIIPSRALPEGNDMAVYQYVVLLSAVRGREAEFDAWYDGRHLADVAKVPGVTSARRFPIVSIDAGDCPTWRSLALYELETDGDPKEILAQIKKRSGTEAMPVPDCVDKRGLVQVVALDRNRR